MGLRGKCAGWRPDRGTRRQNAVVSGFGKPEAADGSALPDDIHHRRTYVAGTQEPEPPMFERKYKGSSAFLESTRRGAIGASSTDGAPASESGDKGAIDAAVLRALTTFDGKDEGALCASVCLPSTEVNAALRRLEQEGFIKRQGDNGPWKLTPVGERAVRYSRGAKR